MLRSLLILCSLASLPVIEMKSLREEFVADEDFLAAKAECVKELNINPEEISKLDEQKETKEIPESIFCMFRCIQKKQGLLDENDKIDVEKLKNGNKYFESLSEDKKKEAEECVESLDPIKECMDIIKLAECFKKVAE